MNITVHTRKMVTIEMDADAAWELCEEIGTIPTSGSGLPLLTELYNKLENENLQ